MLTAKQQFLIDLKSDKDYIEHKKNCICVEKYFIFTYRVASVDNDVYRRRMANMNIRSVIKVN